MSEYRFSPESWSDGARIVERSAEEFVESARAILARLQDLGDLGSPPSTGADEAVSTILQSLHAAAEETVGGLAEGLTGEAFTMALTARTYATREELSASMAHGII